MIPGALVGSWGRRDQIAHVAIGFETKGLGEWERGEEEGCGADDDEVLSSDVDIVPM